MAATITLLAMQGIKRPIKRKIAAFVAGRAEKSPKWRASEQLYRKRCNVLILILAFAASFCMFALLAAISPLIHQSIKTGVLTGIVALAEYAILDQLLYGWEWWDGRAEE